MKYLTLIIFPLAITVLLLLIPSALFAQTLTSQKAFEDYQFQLSNYTQAYSDYNEAKGFYKNNPTLQLREEARKETLEMLKSRDLLMVVYLTAIRTQLAETKGLTTDEKATIFTKLDPEVTWYQSHIVTYGEGDELATLFTKSDECKNRYEKTTKFIILDTLFNISLSQEIGIRVEHEAVYADLKNYIDDQVNQGKLTPDPFNRWINDTNTVLSILNQNEAQSRKKIETLYTRSYNPNAIYKSGVDVLNKSLAPMSQLNNYLSEMLTTISSLSQ